MAVKLITEETEKQVTLLKDAEIEFVSLVRHGANRMPFRVVKQDKKGGGEKLTKGNYAIQSIILPKDVELSEVASIKGLEYLSEANLENRRDFDGYFRLDQMDSVNFESESFKMLKVGNGWLLVGALTGKAKADEALTLSEEQVMKLSEMPVSPMNSIIGDPDAAAQMALASSFRELFEQELYAMLDIVHGTLKQAASDPKKRKSQIMGAIDSFKNFLSMGLDAIAGSAVGKMEKPFTAKNQKNTNKGDEVMDFTSNEFKDAVSQVIKPLLSETVETLKKELSPKDSPRVTVPEDMKVEVDDKDDKKEKKEKEISSPEVLELRKSVEDLTKVVKAMGDQLEVTPGAGDDPGTDAVAAAAEAKKKAEKETLPTANDSRWKDKKIDVGVFAGMLSKKVAA